MKSYNGLFERMTDPKEIEAAIREAAKGKTHRRSVQKTLNNLPAEVERIRQRLITGNFRVPRHKAQTIQEGAHRKVRRIEKPYFRGEQIIHHLLIRQLKPIIEPRIGHHVYGSLPGRGALKAMQVMCRWRDGYGGKKFYVAELDIRKFYPSIKQEVLKAQLSRLIRDKRFLEVLFAVIDGTDRGLPLGYYTSPWLSHLYLFPLDNYIVQQLKPDHYCRYADNVWLYGTNKKDLHRQVFAIQAFLQPYGLTLNKSWQVYRFEHVDRKTGEVRGRAINALGYVIHHNRVTMRKGILKRARKKANRIYRRRRLRLIDAAGIVSYCGWFKHTNTYGYYQIYIKPKVNIRRCRKRIAALSRKRRMTP